ncbi:MAG: hypothetical protein HRU19_27625 [Pseudobacteriovorax sp.]|nr:hypothetical protein [Pseudobacteriovorax sp.]
MPPSDHTYQQHMSYFHKRILGNERRDITHWLMISLSQHILGPGYGYGLGRIR